MPTTPTQKLSSQQLRLTPIADYLRILYRGRWPMLISFLTIMAVTSYFTFTAIPEYEAGAKVMVIEDASMGLALFEAGGFVKQATMINNQVEILKSRALAKSAAQKLLTSSYADQLAMVSAAANLPGGSRPNAQSKTGDTRADTTGLRDNDPINQLANRLRANLSVIPLRGTDMIEIKVKANSPEEAAFITNTFTEAYSEMNRAMSRAEARQVKNFLEEQLNTIKSQLAESETALKDYMEQEKAMALPSETEQLIEKVSEFESLYKEAETELRSDEQRLAYVDQQLDRYKKKLDFGAFSEATNIAELKAGMAELQKKRVTYVANLVSNGVYDETHPELKSIDDQIEQAKQRFKSEVARLAAQDLMDPLVMSEDLVMRRLEIEANIQATKPKVTALKEIVDSYAVKLESLPDKKLKLARLQRTAQVDEKIYLMMKEKYEELRITEVGQLGDVRIIEPAEPPGGPIGPNKRLNLILGALFGLGVGIALSFLINLMDSSVRSMEDLERLGHPVLGTIPMINEPHVIKRLFSERNGNNGVHQPEEYRRMAVRLITHFVPKSPISEAYRSLRTNIQYTHVDKPLRTLMVTSPGPGEGKSTSVANLAITMAQMGNRVLVIDADLRRPVLHSVFKTDRRVGLSNVLVGRATIDEAVTATEIENLSVMACGTLPPNPSELLGSSAMERTVARLREDYELVLFDSPPVIAVTDAAVLSRHLDGVILVVKAGKTHREAAYRAYDLLKSVRANLLGTLLNCVKVESMYGSYYYYYHHYYYYGRNNGHSSNGSVVKETKKKHMWPWA